MNFLLPFLVAFAGGVYFLYRYQPVDAPLSLQQVIIAYVFRILLGGVYGFVMIHYFPGDDTNLIQRIGLEQHEILVKDPVRFLKDFLYHAEFSKPGPLWRHWYYMLGHWEEMMLVKSLAVFNIFSSGNYYVNVVLIDIFSFKGVHWLMAAMLRKSGTSNKRLIYLMLFFFPGVTFWLSGIRAEPLLAFFIGALIYVLATERKLWRLIPLTFCVLILRSQLLACLAPGIIGWLIRKKTKHAIEGAYVLVFLLLLAGSFLPPSLNPLRFIAAKQADFFSLPGKTLYFLPALDGHMGTLFKALPFAVLNAIARPFFFDARGLFQMASSIDTLLMWVVIIFVLVRTRFQFNEFELLWLLGALACVIVIGLIVPFPGAIIRYRAIPALLIVTTLATALAREAEKTANTNNKKLYS